MSQKGHTDMNVQLDNCNRASHAVEQEKCMSEWKKKKKKRLEYDVSINQSVSVH
jgi:predicted GIY-YIG superfamily endonuclease